MEMERELEKIGERYLTEEEMSVLEKLILRVLSLVRELRDSRWE